MRPEWLEEVYRNVSKPDLGERRHQTICHEEKGEGALHAR